METISLIPNTVLNSLYVNERKNCTGGSIVLDDRHTDYFIQVTGTTNINIDRSLLAIPNNCSVQFKLIVWSNKANVLNFSGCSIEQIEVRRGESTFTMQWTPGVNVWSVIPDVLSGYNEVPLMAWSRPYNTAKAIASQRGLQSYNNNSDFFDVFGVLTPFQLNSSNWDYGPNNHGNCTAYVWSIKPFMVRSLQLHFTSNSASQYLPSTFTLYGSNDHKNWTAILSNAEVSYSSGNIQTINITGTNNFYRAFKFEFFQNNSESSYIPPISILGYEGSLIDNRHFDWMIPSIGEAAGGYTATVDTSNLIDVSGNAYSLLVGSGFAGKKTSGTAWTFTYELPVAKKPCGIYIKTRSNGGDSCIGSMGIFGSNDSGTTWTEIAHVDSGALYGVQPGGSQDFTYMFACSTAYDNFRIEVYSSFSNTYVDGGIWLGIQSMNFICEVPDANSNATTIIPTLSSDSQDGYIVSASNTDDGDYYKMFDNNLSTFSAGHFDSGEWIINVQLPEATVINGIYMYSRPDDYYNQTPYMFSVQGSNDNSNWTVLESYNLGSSYWNRSSQLGVFTFSNSTAYVYYRVVCTASVSGTFCGLGELGLCANAYLPSVNWTEEQYVVPVMSSDSQDGYIASASSYWPQGNPFYAFDRQIAADKKWLTASGAAVSGSWIKIQLPTAQSVNVFQIQAPDESGQQSRVPTAFKIQGSNDDSNWTDLVDVSGISWNSAELKSWNNTSTTAYLYYRIYITANGGDSLVAIGEWNLIKKIIHDN